ncbi:hypothetical protein O181_015386 [Austropuccinia psidii MF-1]|uniref:Uncharacterized protein n=1 Tax=Austropuccinia psidii MF-1 TaxID=1389203 RepID=A0A9Q3C3N2_9BASI|nr:hypothetical protein [Austropuccinia psidii MF-1]
MPVQSSPPLTMLTLQQCPIDVSNPPTSCLPSNILPLPHACVILSYSYHAYAPAAPYRYVSLPSTPCLQSTMLMLLHARPFFPLLNMLTLLLFPIDMHPPRNPMSSLAHLYASTHPIHSLRPLPCLRSCSALNI